MYVFESDVYLRMELLGHKIYMSSALLDTASFQKSYQLTIYSLASFDWYSQGCNPDKVVELMALILKLNCGKRQTPAECTFPPQGSDLSLTLI